MALLLSSWKTKVKVLVVSPSRKPLILPENYIFSSRNIWHEIRFYVDYYDCKFFKYFCWSQHKMFKTTFYAVISRSTWKDYNFNLLQKKILFHVKYSFCEKLNQFKLAKVTLSVGPNNTSLESDFYWSIFAHSRNGLKTTQKCWL